MDTWPPQLPSLLPSPSSTPTRSSRTKGTTNETSYPSFDRTTRSGSSTSFSIGDTVLISPKAHVGQKWLFPPPYLGNGRGKGKKRVDPQGQYKGWRHEDGLEAGEKVAVIVGLFEDEMGKMMGRFRWFARPGAVWSSEGPEEGEEVEPYELYYTADSTYLYESRPHLSRSPSTSALTPSTPRSRSLLASKTPLCTDVLPLSVILSHVDVYSPAEFASRSAGTKKTFVVKKVFDAKPRAGGEFIGEIDWDEVWRKGVGSKEWDTEEIRAEEEQEAVGKKRKAREVDLDPEPDADETDGDDAGSEFGEVEVEVEDDDDDDDDEDEVVATVTRSRKKNRTSNSATPTIETPKKKSAFSKGRRVVPQIAKKRIEHQQSRERKRTKFHAKGNGISSGLPPPFTTSPSFLKLDPFEKAKALLHVSATPECLPRRDQQRSKIKALLGDAIIARTGTCLYIHGVPGTGKTATVHSVVRDLQQDEEMDHFQFVEINGMKISEPNTAFSLLWEAVSGNKLAPKQALAQLENHFQTPDPTRKTTVVLVDELDQMITKKQDVIYNFFNWPHVAHSRLIVIAIANTMDLPERELSGKIRSRLGSNRIPFPSYAWQDLEAILEARLNGLEVFGHMALQRISKQVAGVSGDARRALDIARRTVEKVDQFNKLHPSEKRLCTMQDVTDSYKEMTNYGSNIFIKRASMQQQIFLLSLAQTVKRFGVQEVELGDVLAYHLLFLNNAGITPVPNQADLFTIVADLHAMRLVSTDSQRLDYFQKVRSMVEDVDLWTVLRGVEALKKFVPASG